MSGPVFDPEMLKRCVMSPAEAEAFKLKAVKRYVVHADVDGRILMEEAHTDLLRARLIMEVALRRFERWSLRVGEQHRTPRVGDYPPAVQSVMDKMRTFLGRPVTSTQLPMEREALEELLSAVTAKAAPDTTQPIMWSGSPDQSRRMFAAIRQARKVLGHKLDE